MTTMHSLMLFFMLNYFLILSFLPTITLLLFRLFHFLMSLTVQPYFLEMELRVSPFFTVWVLTVLLVEDLLVEDLLAEDLLLVLVDELTCAMGPPER